MGRGSLKDFFPNLRSSAPAFTAWGFFLPVAELLEPLVDVVAFSEEQGNGLLPEVFCLFNDVHLISYADGGYSAFVNFPYLSKDSLFKSDSISSRASSSVPIVMSFT